MAGANVKNYLSNQNSSFFALEDVDDDEFLKNSRNNFGHGQTGNFGRYGRECNSLEDRRQQILLEKQRLENESLASTERSLRMLKESEDVGIATAEELQKQREQLERTEKNLDNINSTLRYTQKKIEGFKNVFGSIKNYLTKKSDGSIAGVSKDGSFAPVEKTSYTSENRNSHMSQLTHPALKLHGIENDTLSINDRLEHNIDQISLSVKSIKGLAINLGEEIESQNELMDRILDKADKSDITLKKQNKEIDKILKNK